MFTAMPDQHNHEAQPSSQTRAVRQALAAMGSRIVGQCAAIQEVARALADLATSRKPALLVGEPGTGKRFFARNLHDAASQGSFVVLSDEAAPIDAGALLRAAESARGGTLLVVGMDRLSPELQDELVALANQGETRLLGAVISPLDPNRCTDALRALFTSSTLLIPTLRERAEDLPELIQHFFELHTMRARRTDLRGISPEAMALLEGHTFLDHVSGLEQAIDQAVAFAEGPHVTVADLPESIRETIRVSSPLLLGALPAQGLDLRAAVEEFETRMILQALERTGWNKNRASRLLGLNRTTLVEMIKRKRLAPPLGHRKSTVSTQETANANTNTNEPHVAAG